MNILVVDDQPNLARVTAIALRVLGCETQTAASWADASEKMTGDRFDAVFLDVNLGAENGFDHLAVLNHRWPRLPVVMFTAQTRDEVVGEASRRGAFACLVKPFDLDELRDLLAKIEAHHQSAQPLPETHS